MNWLLLILLAPLLSAIFYLLASKKSRSGFWVSNIFFALAIILITGLESGRLIAKEFSANLLTLNGLQFNLALQWDHLVWIMLLLVFLVSLMVHQYAWRYLYSDHMQKRFMAQLSIATFSVCLLVMSANLLTAFIAWQLIGFSIYLLLNHFHYDSEANRAAKKKFIINRVGDLTFLFAVILCYQALGTSDYSALFSYSVENKLIFANHFSFSTVIYGLIFLAIMTKSSQFPFHIWLPDTMETPTPVSAFMHAGVINAGGLLLARLSIGVSQNVSIMVLIAIVGLLTILFAAFFMLSQTDVKKQLAYSTMGQMGYMVLQCGLGCFSGAIFHLVTHGFFKAYLFLNAGNTLFEKNPVKRSARVSNLLSIISIITTLVVSIVVIHLIHPKFLVEMIRYPLLVFFMLLTIILSIRDIYKIQNKAIVKIISLIAMIVFILIYSWLFDKLSYALSGQVVFTSAFISIREQLLLIFIFIVVYLTWQFSTKNIFRKKISAYLYYLSVNKCFIEEAYRRYLLNPIRSCGDWFYRSGSFKRNFFCIAAIILVLPALIRGFGWASTSIALAIGLITLSLVFLIAANRGQSMKQGFTYLAFSQICFLLLIFILPGNSEKVLGVYYLVNSGVLVLAFGLLVNYHKNSTAQHIIPFNKLTWFNVYITAILFSFVGLPGTSSFISETLIIQELLKYIPWMNLVYLANMMMLAITILHALQTYVFNPSISSRLNIQLSPLMHAVCILVIAINVFNGIFPNVFFGMVTHRINL